MSYTYNSASKTLLVEHKGRVKTYTNIELFGIEACLTDFENTWGYR